MRFKVVNLIGRDGFDVSAAEFEQIVGARRGLLAVLAIEEKFNLLLENYAEFEADLLTRSLRRLVFAESGWSGLQDDIHAVNRRLANVLSSTRLYIDQILHELSALSGSVPSIVEFARSQLSSEYDLRLGYRAMEVIRNHLQHRNFPVRTLSVKMVFDRDEEPRRVRHHLTPCLSVADLREDSKIKQSVVTELAAAGDAVPITPLVREYVEALGRIHHDIRAALADHVARWDKELLDVLERGTATFTSPVLLAAICESDGNEEPDQSEQLFAELTERRLYLASRSAHASHLANHYVSGNTPPTDGM
jgi:hypothetical protein